VRCCTHMHASKHCEHLTLRTCTAVHCLHERIRTMHPLLLHAQACSKHGAHTNNACTTTAFAAVAHTLQIVLAALEQMSQHTAAAAFGGATPYSTGRHSTAYDEATVSTDTIPNSPNRYRFSRYSTLVQQTLLMLNFTRRTCCLNHTCYKSDHQPLSLLVVLHLILLLLLLTVTATAATTSLLQHLVLREYTLPLLQHKC
jgi:hypothetical protein